MSDYKEFFESPSLEKLEKFKKDELLDIARILQIEIKRSMRKFVLKKLIVEVLVDEDSLPSEALEEYKEELVATTVNPTTDQLQIQLQIEQLKTDITEAQLKLEAERIEA